MILKQILVYSCKRVWVFEIY